MFFFPFSFSIAHSLRHKPTGQCLHLYGGSPVEGVECCLWQGCDEERTKVTFMKQGNHCLAFDICLNKKLSRGILVTYKPENSGLLR